MALIPGKLILTYVFDWLYFTQCYTSFLSIDHLLYLCEWFLILSHLIKMRTIFVLIGIFFVIIWDLVLLLVNSVSGFRLELMYISLIKNDKVNPHWCPWFSAACAAAIVHRNHLLCLYQKDKSSDSKVKFREVSNRCKRVLEATKLAYANKTIVFCIW